MKEMCPVCNGLIQLSTACPFCSQPMYDSGIVADFLGPYSPYMDEDSLKLANLWTPRDDLSVKAWDNLTAEACDDFSAEAAEESSPCIHLMVCPKCGWDTRVPVTKRTEK